MCEEMVQRPRAIYPYELSNKQLVKLNKINKGNIVSAWRTPNGFIVYMDGEQPKCYFWKTRVWVEYEEERHG